MLYNIFLSGDDVIMKKRILNITFAALFTAITAALSQAAIPTPFGVPLTLQTFAVALCGYVLGIKWGLASIITYILLGVFGVPVFSGFKGGAQVLFGATGGFIFGFLFFGHKITKYIRNVKTSCAFIVYIFIISIKTTRIKAV